MTTASREEALFSDALARPPAEREMFLDVACGNDVALRRRLNALLAAHGSPHFESPAIDRGTVPLTPEERAGDVIGRYKLLQKIGEGGCGVVWMAEQEDPVRRRVALKVIKLGMDTKAVIARFEAERQALAMMEHPNIAKVLDGGATVTGRPYFVMELVRGIPITRFCDDNNFPTRARLELFVQVCHAIQHAHQKGIIHRDIKPSNVLVTLHDDVAVPMVIDFGIAKATQGRLTDQTLFTAFEQFLGTPVYMSPEQAEFNALDVDTRSDIYSLGVLLYELLTGHPPFEPKTLRDAGIDQVRQIIRETEPPRPSMRVRTLTDEERSTVAKLRGTAPTHLSTLLRGDLDWIVLTAIEKNRVRRYQTANAFAMDIQRSLANEVVVARPPSAVYRVRKSIARNRPAFAAGAAVLGLLVGGLAVAMNSFLREKGARQRAVAAQRTAAQQNSRLDVVLADRLLAEGKNADGIAHLVRAARTDPENHAVAPRLLSALTRHDFLLPEAAPLVLPAPAQSAAYMADGRHIFVLGHDGVVRIVDVPSWKIAREVRFATKVNPHGWAVAEKDSSVFAVFLINQKLVVGNTADGQSRFEPISLPGPVDDGNPRMSLSADGRWLAAAQLSGAVWVWDAHTGELRATLPTHTPQSGDRISYAFSPDGRGIVTHHNSTTQRWSLPEGVPAENAIRETTVGSYRLAAFSPDGRMLIVKYDRGVQLYDSESGAPIGDPIKFGGNLDSMVFSPDGRRVALHNRRGPPVVFDTRAGKAVFENLTPAGAVYDVTFSRDGRKLFANGADGFARVWDMDTGKPTAEPALQQPRISVAVMAPDGGHVVVFSAAGPTHRLRLARTAAVPLVLPESADLFTALPPGLPPPPRFLRVARDRCTVHDMRSGNSIGGFTFPEPVWGNLLGAFHAPDGLPAVAVRTQENTWRAWTVDGVRVTRDVPLQQVPRSPQFSFDRQGRRVAIYRDGESQTLSVWSVQSGRPELTVNFAGSLFRGPEGGASVRFSDDGGQLVFSTSDGRVHVCDAITGVEHARFQIPGNARVASFTFADHGRRLAVTDNDGGVHFWEPATGRLLRSTRGHRDYACFCNAIGSPDGREIVTHSFDGTMQIWDVASGAPRGRPLIGGEGPVWASFTQSGTIVSRSSKGMRLWDAASGLPVNEPVPTMDRPLLTADGRYFCSRAIDSSQLWSIPPNEGAAPSWLLRAATVFASKRVTEHGEFVTAMDDIARIEELRREVNALPNDAPYAEWGKWLLADPVTRSIAPGFTLTPREADELAARLAPAEELR